MPIRRPTSSCWEKITKLITCIFICNPDKGDSKGKIPIDTRFTDLLGDWKCPICGAGKKTFKPLAGPGSATETVSQFF